MKKENRINSIMESASEIKETEPNPYLYNKILSRLSQPVTVTAVNYKFKLAWVAVITMVIAMNVSAFAVYQSKVKKQNETTAIESLSDEFSTDTSYNY
jgi:hypothetical protein